MSALEKSLGPVSGTAMMLNTVLGVGILTLPGLAAAQAGGAALWTWLVCALAIIPLLAVFALLASRFPEAGGVAHIAGCAFGRMAALITSFLFLGAVFLGLPSIALTGGNYLEAATGIPTTMTAVSLVIAASLANLAIPRLAARIGSVAAVLVVIFLFCLVGFSFVIVAGGGMALEHAWQITEYNPALIFPPFMLVFFAFTGWEVALSTTGEFKNPKRDVPLAVGVSFAIAVMFYVLCAFTVIAAGKNAYNAAPFVAILKPVLGDAASIIIAIGVLLLIAANLFAAFWAVSRMVLSVAREGALPEFLSRTRNGIPVSAILFNCGAFLAVLSADAFGRVDINGLISSAGLNFFLIYGITALALVKLGRTPMEKVFGLLSMLIVAGLSLSAGKGLAYPVFLISAALLVNWVTQSRLATTAPAE